MTKNKVVIFDAHGKAKIHITDSPESFVCAPDERMFVNPNLNYVLDVPPELWNLEGDMIVPLFDADAIKQRLADIGVKAFTNMADAEIKKNVSKLVDIPARLQALEMAIERTQKEVEHEFHELNMCMESRMLAHSTHIKASIYRLSDEGSRIFLLASKWIIIAVSAVLALNLIQIGLHFIK